MSGFVATAATGSESGDAGVIRNDGWFPDLEVATVRNVARIDGTVSADRLADAIRYAMVHTNIQLGTYKAGHRSNGVPRLADVSPDEIDGEKRLVMLYRRAVICTVKADLTESYRDFDSTDAGLRRGAELDPAVSEQRRNASWAVRDILGRTHTVVELI